MVYKTCGVVVRKELLLLEIYTEKLLCCLHIFSNEEMFKLQTSDVLNNNMKWFRKWANNSHAHWSQHDELTNASLNTKVSSFQCEIHIKEVEYRSHSVPVPTLISWSSQRSTQFTQIERSHNLIFWWRLRFRFGVL